MPSLDLDLIRHALEAARKNGFREVEVGLGEDSFSAKLMPSKSQPKGSPDGPADPVPEETLSIIAATAVGYFRPGEMPLEVGEKVQKGNQVAVIVALGIANDVESKWNGVVTEVLVKPDQPVEFGQPLAKVRAE